MIYLYLFVFPYMFWAITSPSSVHGRHHNEPARRADARRQTTKRYVNQVVAHKQQLRIPLMMGW